jgi:RND family efflux transporter MFP subunit
MAILTEQADLSRLKINRGSAPDPSDRRGKKKWVAFWILLALGFLITLFSLYRTTLIGAKRVEATTVTRVNPLQANTILNASGYVVAQRQAAVASKGTGRLVELKVKEGDRVKKGEILARLESADVAAALSRAQANLNVAHYGHEEAKAELNDATLSYERKKELLDSGLVSQAEFDAVEARFRRSQAAVAAAEAGVKSAEAAVQAAQVDVENTNIRAPFDGTVLTKNAEVGEMVTPFGSAISAKAAVVSIADMTSLQIEANVSESNIEKIHVGQRCEIILDAYPEAKQEGIVQTIVPTADRAKATVLTKIRFLNRDDRVLPEMSAKVAFLSEPIPQGFEKPAVSVHPGAIVLKGERRVAFRIRGDRVDEITVEVGSPIGNLIEIKSGLTPGDQVVLNPPERLSSGDRVQIKR